VLSEGIVAAMHYYCVAVDVGVVASAAAVAVLLLLMLFAFARRLPLFVFLLSSRRDLLLSLSVLFVIPA
jgi:hypothetical protein